MPAQLLPFISRAEQVSRRGYRNYSRYMQVVKGLVAPDGPERIRWQQEAEDESCRDAEWSRRHGPIPGGAVVLPFSSEELLRGVYRHWTRRTRELPHTGEPT